MPLSLFSLSLGLMAPDVYDRCQTLSLDRSSTRANGSKISAETRSEYDERQCQREGFVIATPIVTAFLDGFSWAGLFTKLQRPGAPTQLFADENSDCAYAYLIRPLREVKERWERQSP